MATHQYRVSSIGEKDKTIDKHSQHLIVTQSFLNSHELETIQFDFKGSVLSTVSK